MQNTTDLKRLLVLDDEPDVATTLCLMAEGAFFETQHTSDAEVFLEKIDTWSPTHVVVDLQMPDRDGVEVLQTLAKMGCGAAVIIASGLGGRILDSAARAAKENGLQFIGTLSKPFSRAAFRALLTTDVPTSLPRKVTSSAANLSSVTEEQLADALHNQVFVAHFQPKISCTNGALAGFECLARWPLKDGSMIPPDLFISLAEQTGLIHELSRQVYHFAMANLPQQVHSQGVKIALNLSPINLKDEGFPRWLLEKCEENDVAPSQVILEVTETASMDSPLALLENLTQFRIKGFQLSIDDFGVGYSSLVQLARLPFSELKIDQMFVKTVATSKESQKIVTAIVNLGKSLGLDVTAEGVEDPWALNFLHEIGCDEAQGYFIARPMATPAASAWTQPPFEV
ncbi:MAG: EAL domain-containing response regulator [Marinobacter sp.]|uniref:EAL domain-containing response regulator n=1 Tax=Marinobacter sp. TaxID=50741 RepID=UPI0034A03872